MSDQMSKGIPPRLFIIFATEAYEAVVYRRGPSSWFHILRWNTQNDLFYSGAWIKARIYPERCDLSPDGELLLTFLHQGRKFGTNYSDSWNAISRSPWLYALGLWSQGTTYGGGGRFIDNRSAILRFYKVEPHPDHLGSGLTVSFTSEHPRKPDPTPLHRSTKEVANAEWSGRDQRGRLIYTIDGKIMCLGDKQPEAVCLADLNDLQPAPQPAPAAATEPLRALKTGTPLRRRVNRRQPLKRKTKFVSRDFDES